ncbi:MAG: hypothetical protein AABY49_09590 [Planctomycetota bacterium]
MAKIEDKAKAYVIQCLACGATCSIDKEIIIGLHKGIYNECQFEIDHSHLMIKGYCKRCQESVLESS